MIERFTRQMHRLGPQCIRRGKLNVRQNFQCLDPSQKRFLLDNVKTSTRFTFEFRVIRIHKLLFDAPFFCAHSAIPMATTIRPSCVYYWRHTISTNIGQTLPESVGTVRLMVESIASAREDVLHNVGISLACQRGYIFWSNGAYKHRPQLHVCSSARPVPIGLR